MLYNDIIIRKSKPVTIIQNRVLKRERNYVFLSGKVAEVYTEDTAERL